MIEVELRARISDLENVRWKLKEFGAKFLKKEKQVDKIFGHPMFLDSENMIIEGGICPRIRKKGEKIILEFKEIYRDGAGIEIKSNLNDIDLGVNFLTKLGFNEAFIVSKEREIYSLNGLEICLDSVESLGNFIEVEKMIESVEQKDEAKRECLRLLERLEVTELESRKYGDLIQEKLNREEVSN